MPEAAPTKVKFLRGEDLLPLFEAASRWLEGQVPAVNALNVFPVPDGDTGTNMASTLRATVEACRKGNESKVEAVAQALARGALMGARGNSGVILSQVIRGMATSFQGKDRIAPRALAEALVEASRAAYKGVSNPVEGTLLTVIREAATAAVSAASRKDADIISTLSATLQSAQATLARTPFMLQVLRDAGVVDAGGQGLCIILEGFLRYLRRESLEAPEAPQSSWQAVQEGWLQEAGHKQWGFCTEFFIQGQGLHVETLRQRLEPLGDSLIVVGEPAMVRIHIHTLDTDAVLSYARSQGAVEGLKIDNIDRQQQDFSKLQEQVRTTPGPIPLAVVAVASGEGMARVFESLHVSRVVWGGQTMNPSTGELLQAAEEVPSRQVIFLPNNGNVIPAAIQVQTSTDKRTAVVPTKNMPQGIAAMLAFNPEDDVETNLARMTHAAASLKTLEITRAVRDARIGDREIRQGQALGFLGDDLRVVAGDITHAAKDLLREACAEENCLVTLYYGADTAPQDAEALGEWIRASFNACEVEVVFGGQPHYAYLISVE